jgi:hypothetical protein
MTGSIIYAASREQKHAPLERVLDAEENAREALGQLFVNEYFLRNQSNAIILWKPSVMPIKKESFTSPG